jgi:alkylhydroperoxidase family enzyme
MLEMMAMTRLQPLSRDAAPEDARPMMDAAERWLGEPSVPAGIQARCPPILEAGRILGAAPGRSNTLPAELRSLVCVRVAQIVTCPF